MMLSEMTTDKIYNCAALLTAVYTAAPWYHESVTIETASRYIRDLTQTPGFMGFTYTLDQTLSGMVLGTINDYFFEPQYKIDELAVAIPYRRQGVGRRMLMDLENYLAEKGVVYITLQTSNEIPAYDFYTKSGYQCLENTVCMAKELK